MKIVCTKSELLKGVNITLRAVPVRTTMTILECILIDATELDIKLTANDMELGIETTIDGDIIEKGKIAIEAKFLPILSVNFLTVKLQLRLTVILMLQ